MIVVSDIDTFPYWVAIDKHTEEGKKVIKIVAQKTGKKPREISWIFFYFASVIENQLEPSSWWKRENEWRLHKIGLNYILAEKIWTEILPVFKEELHFEEISLRNHIHSSKSKESSPQQLNLFLDEGA